MSLIYLDYNATAPIFPSVIAVMQEVMGQAHNPSSVHALGRHAKHQIEQARRVLADAISCFPAELIFTSSATEAINLGLRSMQGRAVAVCATEHAAVLKTANAAHTLPVSTEGLLDMDALERFMQQHEGACVAVMLANNETGVVQPIKAIADKVHAYGGVLFCDAVQALGKIPVDVNLLGADMMSLCAHKMGGPHGAGALYISQKLEAVAHITGGEQELGRRAGTENVAAICGFAEAVRFNATLRWQAGVRRWLDAMELQCASLYPDEAIVIAHTAPRLPNTTALHMPHVSSETQLMKADLAGFCISAGSACSSGRMAHSHVMAAMSDTPLNPIRISAGWQTTEQDIQQFADFWCAMAKASQKKPQKP
jgi:cysteine desulfurase